MFPKIDTNDSDSKAIFIHALSADRTRRLSRPPTGSTGIDRTSSETALAYMAAAFVRMDRPTFAEDLLKILDAKLVEEVPLEIANSRHAILKR